MNFYIIVSIIFYFNTYFFGSKSTKLTNVAGVAHNVPSILNSFTLFILYYIFRKNKSSLRKYIYIPREHGFQYHVLSFTYKHSSK